ncbi:hypothetical protein FRB98_007020 [Tulasnella sp. 332]|nr:hypothetical protein FRB98_007020 [Tulasnella sp. 332]
MSHTDQIDTPDNLISDIGTLVKNIGAGAEVFFRWREQSQSIFISIQGNYQEQLRKFSADLVAQATFYKQAVELGIEEAKGGSRVAHDIVYFLDQLIAGTTPQEEVADLLEDLSDKTRELCETTRKLRDKFLSVRGALMQASRDSLPKLKNEIENDKAKYSAERASSDNKTSVSAFAAWSCFVVGLAFPPALVGTLPAVGAALSHSSDADFYKRRVLEAEAALDVLNRLASGLDTAIDIVGKHVDFWAKLHNGIEAALKDQKGLVRKEGLPRIAMVKKHRSSWLELEKQFDSYGSLALASKQILEIKAS